MNSSSWEAVRRIAADVFSQPAGSLTPQSSPETVESWDSVQHLNLVMALEEHFSLPIEPEEFEKMNSLEAICLLIDRKTQAGAAAPPAG